MKNIQVIDGAENCTYDIFAVTDEEFKILFPDPGQDIEFIEDVIKRVGDEDLGRMMKAVWDRPVGKSDVVGIHGTLFYELIGRKKIFHPAKKGAEIIQYPEAEGKTQRDETKSDDGARRRFHVDLLIVHPAIDPTEISAVLGLDGSIVHRAGDRRIAPNGAQLRGTYPDTRWRHTLRCEVRDQYFAGQVKNLVNRLVPHKGFLHRIRAAGGAAAIIVQFLGDDYFGDEIAAETLATMADLHLNFGVECFVVPQRE